MIEDRLQFTATAGSEADGWHGPEDWEWRRFCEASDSKLSGVCSCGSFAHCRCRASDQLQEHDARVGGLKLPAERTF